MIELIVVIGIIAASAGILGLALRDGNPAVALQSAQGTVASMLASARSEAALKNVTAAVVVYATNDASGRYLHALAIADRGDAGWNRVGDYVALPEGVYVVPPTSSTPVPSKPLAALAVDGVDHWGISYTPTGTVTGSAQIVLAAARRTAEGGLAFDHADNVRGVMLSTYGAVTFVNDASGFAP